MSGGPRRKAQRGGSACAAVALAILTAALGLSLSACSDGPKVDGSKGSPDDVSQETADSSSPSGDASEGQSGAAQEASPPRAASRHLRGPELRWLGVASEGDWKDGFLSAEKAAEAMLAEFTENRRLPVVSRSSTRSRIVPRYSRAATDLVLFDQEVRCWSKRDWKAILREERAYWNAAPTSDIIGLFGKKDRVHLAPEICKGLDVLAYSKRRPASGIRLLSVAAAAETLAHEAEHRRGTANEAVTECRAAQQTRLAARLLGATRPYAALLAATFWADVYPYKPAAYRTAACKDGGRLDLRPGSSVWP